MIVVVDSSALITLARIGPLDLPHRITDVITVRGWIVSSRAWPRCLPPSSGFIYDEILVTRGR